MNRSTIRDLAFKLLYEIEIQKDNSDEHTQLYLENNQIINDDAKAYICDIIKGVNDNLANINEYISRNLKSDWSIERISKISVSILRLAIYEIVYKQLPYKVVVNEAVELAKKYGEDNAHQFINGILASVIEQLDIK